MLCTLIMICLFLASADPLENKLRINVRESDRARSHPPPESYEARDVH